MANVTLAAVGTLTRTGSTYGVATYGVGTYGGILAGAYIGVTNTNPSPVIPWKGLAFAISRYTGGLAIR